MLPTPPAPQEARRAPTRGGERGGEAQRRPRGSRRLPVGGGGGRGGGGGASTRRRSGAARRRHGRRNEGEGEGAARGGEAGKKVTGGGGRRSRRGSDERWGVARPSPAGGKTARWPLAPASRPPDRAPCSTTRAIKSRSDAPKTFHKAPRGAAASRAARTAPRRFRAPPRHAERRAPPRALGFPPRAASDREGRSSRIGASSHVQTCILTWKPKVDGRTLQERCRGRTRARAWAAVGPERPPRPPRPPPPSERPGPSWATPRTRINRRSRSARPSGAPPKVSKLPLRLVPERLWKRRTRAPARAAARRARPPWRCRRVRPRSPRPQSLRGCRTSQDPPAST